MGANFVQVERMGLRNAKNSDRRGRIKNKSKVVTKVFAINCGSVIYLWSNLV
jgi:hypothetical protein